MKILRVLILVLAFVTVPLTAAFACSGTKVDEIRVCQSCPGGFEELTYVDVIRQSDGSLCLVDGWYGGCGVCVDP